MSRLALARKYRPRNFAELVGQEHVVKALAHALDQNRLHHAYLLTGTRGVGKTTIARIIAKALNCETGISSTPCGQCDTCRAIDAGRFVDLLELDAASNTQVDNMRELLENALYAPTAGRFKVYIIDEVHMLSRSAFNAMLKTLEEPPEHVKFVLATTDPQKIPVTVLSRCLQFGLKQLTTAQIRGQLEKVLAAENVEQVEAGALALLARAAQGSMRDSLSLLDQAIVHGAGEVREAGVRDMLGIVDTTYLFVLLECVANGDGPGALSQAETMSARGLSFEAAMQDLASLLHRLALAQVLPDAIPDDEPERERLLDLARRFTAEDVQLHYQIALRGRADLALAPDEFTGFAMTLLRMLAFMPREDDRPPSPAPQGRGTTKSRPVSDPPRERVPREALPGAAAAGGSDASSPLDRRSWPDTLARLKLGGMARMLAQHCELVEHEGDHLVLGVAEEHKHLLDQAYRDKFVAALRTHFPALRVDFRLGSGGDHTLAVKDAREQAERQQNAEAAISSDPFVQELMESLDARVVDGSIQPVQPPDQ
ncbi:MAG: DNA polymerase III subunit gamma/tau [Betaproteobacteria bacterium]|nr:DNA polymerase III subunit gamma/tau [Betaproteobacteria bacterium]